MASPAYDDSLVSESEVNRYIRIFAFTIAVQFLHMIEHVAQVIQKFVLGFSEAHGLIGQLDLEQVHFGFNTIYFLAVVYIFLNWLAFGSRLCKRHYLLGGVLLLGVVMQGYHEIEHSVRFFRYLTTDLSVVHGFLDMRFNGVIVHFFLNTAVFTPPVVVFFCAGLHKKLGIQFSLLREKFLARQSG